MFEVHGTAIVGFEPVREAFAETFDEVPKGGSAVCVYHHGQPVVDLWSGVADPDTGRAWDTDTLQFTYSVTKSATGACAHLLAQRGLLDLDAPVASYWPEFAAAGKDRIPVRWAAVPPGRASRPGDTVAAGRGTRLGTGG